MIKKSVHIFLTLLLLGVTTGFNITKHYCSARLAGISLVVQPQSCCDNVGEMACCRNETTHVTLETDFVHLTSSFVFQKDFQFSALCPNDTQFIPLTVVIQGATISTKPPPPPVLLPTRLALLQTYLC